MAGQKFPEVGLRAVFELTGFIRGWRQYQTMMRDVDRTTQQTAQKVNRSMQGMSADTARSFSEFARKSTIVQDALDNLRPTAAIAEMQRLGEAFRDLGPKAQVNITIFDRLVNAGVSFADAMRVAGGQIQFDLPLFDRLIQKGVDVEQAFASASAGGQAMGQTVSIMGREFTTAALAIGAVTAALGASISLVKQAVKEYTDLSEATRRLHYQTGQLTQEASSYVQVMQTAGISTTSVQRAMTSFLSKVADMRREQAQGEESTNSFAEALAFLDVSILDSAGDLKDTSTLLTEINARYRELGPGVRSAQVATDLFGYSGRYLLPLLVDQEQSLADYIATTERFGSALSALDRKEYEEFRRANIQLKAAIQGVFNYIGRNYIPVLTQVQRILAEVIGIYRTLVTGATDTIAPHEALAWILERVANQLERIHTVVIEAASTYRRLTDWLHPAARLARELAQAEEEEEKARSEAAQAAREAAVAEEELRKKREETLEQLGELKTQLSQKLADIDADARQRWNDILVQRQRDAMDRAIQVAYRLYDLQQAYRARMDDIERDFARRWDDILVKRQREAMQRALRESWQLEDLERSRMRSREQAIRDAASRERDIRREFNQRLADTEREAREKREKLERDHLQRLLDIRQKYLDAVSEAARDNDAVAVARAMRQRARDLRDEQERYQKEQTDLEESLKKQRKAIERDRQERIADHRRELAERLQRIEENHQRQLEDLARQRERERILREMQYQWELEDFNTAKLRQQQAAQEWYEQQLEELRQQQEREAAQRAIAYERQEIDFVKAWQRRIEDAIEWYEREREELAAHLDMTGQMLEAAYADWMQAAGEAASRVIGAITQAYMAEIERFRHYLTTGVIAPASAVRGGGGGTTRSGARVPGAPVFGTRPGFQAGGVAYASGPTTVTMGEGGPETAVFLPGRPGALSVNHSFGRLGVDFSGVPAGMNTQQVQAIVYAVVTQLAKGVQVVR